LTFFVKENHSCVFMIYFLLKKRKQKKYCVHINFSKRK
jgi:hypothetical protein